MYKTASIAIGNESSIGIASRLIHKCKADLVVFDGYSSPTAILSILYCQMRKIPYVISVDGAIKNDVIGLRYKLKRHLITHAVAWLSPSKKGNEKLIECGADPQKIYWYPFTSMRENEILPKTIETEDKKNIRKELNLPINGRIIVSVGRFSYQNGYGKGFDVLLKVASLLDSEITIYIIGDEPTDEFKKYVTKRSISNVYFLGFINPGLLYKYYQAADISILLTRYDVWGLVVNESLANGCPVITTNSCGAGLELIKDGFNGYLINNLEDLESIKRLIEDTLDNNDLLEKMAENSIVSIQSFTIEEMVKMHLLAFRKILER